MIAFVVSVNGQQVCTIGVGDSGMVGTNIFWVGQSGEPGRLSLDVGGLDTRTDEHIRWPDPPEIKVGDTITVQVIETDTVDPPTARQTPAQLREEEKEFLARMEADRQARLAVESGNSAEQSGPPQRKVPRDPEDELPPFAAPWE